MSKQLRQNYTTIIGNHELAKLQGLYDEKVYDDAKHTINKEITDKSKQDELNDKIDQIHKKRALKKNIDKVLTIFPFEKKYFYEGKG